jgi:hypothetical protein
MTLLGHPLHELTALQLKEFLDGAEAEPLLWEAKGTELHKKEVARQVCAFANGLQTAYLILGASQIQGKWMLEAMEFDGDPPAWVTSLFGDVLNPVPLIDVATISLPGGGQIAIVEVPPIATPPCICNGTVFERVSGRTIAVRDPVRLAELYRRGADARQNAISAARHGAQNVLADPDSPGSDSPWLRFAFALSATGHPPDIGSRLFSEGFEAGMLEAAQNHLAPSLLDAPPPLQPEYSTSFEQSNRRLDCSDPRGRGSPCHWHVRVIWDGTVVVCAAWELDSLPAAHLVDLINAAWRAAAELLTELGGYGPAYMALEIDPADVLIGAPTGNPPPHIRIDRGPIDRDFDPAHLASVERELRRAARERVYEPEQLDEKDD